MIYYLVMPSPEAGSTPSIGRHTTQAAAREAGRRFAADMELNHGVTMPCPYKIVLCSSREHPSENPDFVDAMDWAWGRSRDWQSLIDRRRATERNQVARDLVIRETRDEQRRIIAQVEAARRTAAAQSLPEIEPEPELIDWSHRTAVATGSTVLFVPDEETVFAFEEV